jgi:hypothetical protein
MYLSNYICIFIYLSIGIFSNKVLQHLTDVEMIESVDNQHKVLNTDGMICHTCWKGEGNEDINGKTVFIMYYYVLINISLLCINKPIFIMY